MNVLLGVTGSIAAYKAAVLVRCFQKRGCDVQVVMTPAATQFVGELTFRSLSQMRTRPLRIEAFSKRAACPSLNQAGVGRFPSA
jgi:phosphopantothenoylcysteine decarboxylase/phosphopantothenate--cysteine ligase